MQIHSMATDVTREVSDFLTWMKRFSDGEPVTGTRHRAVAPLYKTVSENFAGDAYAAQTINRLADRLRAQRQRRLDPSTC